MLLVNIADCVNPDDPQRRTYREINMELKHSIPVGALVKVKTHDVLGVTFVVAHERDCDGTPLYSVAKRLDTEKSEWLNGFSEEYLEPIDPR